MANGILNANSAMLVMSFCGCMMLMFRAAMFPLAGNEEDDYSWNEVKEREMNQNEGGASDDNQNYVTDEGLNDTMPTEAPMGGQAQQRYDAVGDDNPFEEGNEDYAPKQSSWQ